MTQPLQYLALALLAVAAYTWFSRADRIIGGAGKRSIAFGGVALIALAMWFLEAKTLAILAVAWMLWRSLPWSIGGTLTPRTGSQVAGAAARNLIPAAAAAGCAYWLKDWVAASYVGPLAVFAYLCVRGSVDYAREIDRIALRGEPEPPYLNERLERDRGEWFGIAYAAAIAVELYRRAFL